MALFQIFWTMHICAFFVSLDQLLCKKNEILQQSKQGTDLFGIFLFTELLLVKGHCQSLHCFQCYCGRCTSCSFQIIKHNLSLDAKFYKYLVNFFFFQVKRKGCSGKNVLSISHACLYKNCFTWMVSALTCKLKVCKNLEVLHRLLWT